MDPAKATKVGNNILQVEGGKLVIPKEALNKNQFDNTTLSVYRNKHRNKEITVTADYFADTKFVNITAVDYLSNTHFEQLSTGETKDYHDLVFSSYAAITSKGGKIYVNDESLEHSRTATTAKSVKIGIALPDDSRHISSLSVRRLNAVKNVEDILKNDEQNVNLSKTYKLTYNAGKRRLEFTIDNIDSSSEIMTEFKDGAMKALTEQKDVALDLSKIDLANVTSIRLNNTPANVKTGVTAKTGTVTLEMLFKTSEAATKVKKIYLVQNG